MTQSGNGCSAERLDGADGGDPQRQDAPLRSRRREAQVRRASGADERRPEEPAAESRFLARKSGKSMKRSGFHPELSCSLWRRTTVWFCSGPSENRSGFRVWRHRVATMLVRCNAESLHRHGQRGKRVAAAQADLAIPGGLCSPPAATRLQGGDRGVRSAKEPQSEELPTDVAGCPDDRFGGDLDSPQDGRRAPPAAAFRNPSLVKTSSKSAAAARRSSPS